MKRLFALTLVLIMILSLVACGNKSGTGINKPSEGGQTRGQEENYTVSTKWPDIDYIPEFKKGKLVETFKDGNDNVNISFENVARSDYEAYLEIIKKEFPIDSWEGDNEFLGGNEKGSFVKIAYYEDDKILNIQGVKEGR